MYYGEPSYMSSFNSYGGEAYYYSGSTLDNTLDRIKGFKLHGQAASDGNSHAWRATLKSLYDAIRIEKDKPLAEDFWGKRDLPNYAPWMQDWDHATIKSSSKDVRDWMDANWQKIPKTAAAWVTVVENFQLPPTKAKRLDGSTPTSTPTNGNGDTNGQNGGDPPPAGFKFPWLEVLVIGGIGVGGYLLYQTKVKKKKYAVLDAAKSYATLGGLYADDAAGKAKKYADAKIAQKRAKKNRAYRY